MPNWLYIIVTILVLILITLILTFIHELGHFSVGKWFKVRISEFSVGFGPSIVQWKRGDTTYSIRWLPLGGYVSPLSDEVLHTIEQIKKLNLDDEGKKKQESKLYSFTVDEDYTKQKSLNTIPYYGKVMFILAGVFMNFIFGWLVNTITYQTIGRPTASNKAFIPLNDSNLFFQDNLQNRDRAYIVESFYNPISDDCSGSIPQNPITGFNDIKKSLLHPISVGGYMCVKLENPSINNNPNPIFNNYIPIVYVEDDNVDLGDGSEIYASDKWVINFSVLNSGDPFYKNYIFDANNLFKVNYFDVQNFPEASGNAFVDSWKTFGNSFILFGDIFTLGLAVPDGHQDSYFVGEEDSRMYLFNYLRILSTFSIILFAFNIIPIPPLDGFKFCEYTYEKVTKKSMKPETAATVGKIGWAVVAYITIASIVTFII